MAKLRCFVAMAFEHEDTDEWFDYAVVPTLKALDILDRRIDRIEHNDDIDNRIIAEIDACDFAIADLTYARPSVYFEAGYAQRKVPVIYTCRKDHFRPRHDDPNGNLRVHFDLQMRNIIGWTSSELASFRRRLTRRVRHTIHPIAKADALRQAATAQREAYASLSLLEKRRTVREACQTILRRAGYQPDTRGITSHPGGGSYSHVAWLRRHGDVLSIVSLHCDLAVHYRDLGYIRFMSQRTSPNLVMLGRTAPRLIEHTTIVCSIAKISRPTLARGLPEMPYEHGQDRYVERTDIILPSRRAFRRFAYIQPSDGFSKNADYSCRTAAGRKEIRLRSHKDCFVEDNAWGDQQRVYRGGMKAQFVEAFVIVDGLRSIDEYSDRVALVAAEQVPSAITEPV